MITLVLPILAEQFLFTLVGLVDTYLAGNLPEYRVEATSAVGLAAYVGWLMSMLFALVGTGTTALVARAFGGGSRDEGNWVANQSVLLSIGMGICGAIGMYLLAPNFARWQNMHGATYDITVQYLQIDAISYIGWAFTLVGGAALRGAGDMRTPMVALAVVNAFNVILSCALVYGPGPFPALGVKGIVVGTLFSRLIGGALITAVLIHGRHGLKLRIHLLKPAAAVIRRIVRIGVPAAADGAIMWTGHFLFLMIVARLSGSNNIEVNHTYAAQIVIIRLEAFTYLPASAWAAACATMIGQALGAGLPHRAKQSGHEGAFQCGLLTAVVGAMFVIFAPAFCGIVNKDPQVIATAAPVLMLAGMFQPILSSAIVYLGCLRGAGDTIYPLGFTTLGLGLIRLPLAYLLGITQGYGLFGAWIAVCGDIVFRMIMALVRFARGKWAEIRV
jgi:putative MATE family efflux protein